MVFVANSPAMTAKAGAVARPEDTAGLLACWNPVSHQSLPDLLHVVIPCLAMLTGSPLAY